MLPCLPCRGPPEREDDDDTVFLDSAIQPDPKPLEPTAQALHRLPETWRFLPCSYENPMLILENIG